MVEDVEELSAKLGSETFFDDPLFVIERSRLRRPESRNTLRPRVPKVPERGHHDRLAARVTSATAVHTFKFARAKPFPPGSSRGLLPDRSVRPCARQYAPIVLACEVENWSSWLWGLLQLQVTPPELKFVEPGTLNVPEQYGNCVLIGGEVRRVANEVPAVRKLAGSAVVVDSVVRKPWLASSALSRWHLLASFSRVVRAFRFREWHTLTKR